MIDTLLNYKATLDMILEITEIAVRDAQDDSFRSAWKAAAAILSRQPGYQGYEAMVQHENPNVFTLLVRWESLQAHTEQFTQSTDFSRLTELISPFINGDVRVVHAQPID